MKTHDFLFELGCEELPAAELEPMVSHLAAFIEKKLRDLKLQFGKIEPYDTPRRLAILIRNLQLEVVASTLERKGPVKAAAFDAEGKPTQALQGFLRSCGADLADVYDVVTDKGVWLAVQITTPALKTSDVLSNILIEAVKTIPMKKAMRWGANDFKFLRPVRWMLALLGDGIIPVKLFDITAGRETFGHRFHHPNAISLKNPLEYLGALRAADVMASPEERRETIIKQCQALAPAGLNVHFGKLNEVINLVEWPVPLLCSFEKDFLKLPQAVLIATMEANQRVFPIIDEQGVLQNYFITVANISSKKPDSVIEGNEKVVRARLSDARFFYQEDLKVRLEDHLPELKKISFQQGLGSLFDKTERLKAMAKKIASDLGLDAETASRAALLCKADLLTNMVQEFPELQGYMGEQYAKAQGESNEVAIAIREHYLPNHRGGNLPKTAYGALLAVLDRLDTLVGLFGIDQKPTSSSDPYALRRQAMGVVSILRDMVQYDGWNRSLDIRQALADFLVLYETAQPGLIKRKGVREEIEAFIFDRAKYAYFEDYPMINSRFIEAIESSMKQDGLGFRPAIFHRRILDITLLHECSSEKLRQLVELFKRIRTILANNAPKGLVLIEKGVDTLEKELLERISSLSDDISNKCMKNECSFAIEQALQLIAPIDRFFENFMVMDENEMIRQNRLCLLRNAERALFQIADFSKL